MAEEKKKTDAQLRKEQKEADVEKTVSFVDKLSKDVKHKKAIAAGLYYHYLDIAKEQGLVKAKKSKK